MKTQPQWFKPQTKQALQDVQLRENFRGAMDFLRDKRKTVLPDSEEFTRLQQHAKQIKQSCLNQLPNLLEKLEQRCSANGIQVHWAESTQEANQIVDSIIDRHDGKEVIKGKSMVSEEMHLNNYLAHHGKNCIETDMGEWIVQLANETPSHIIMPAIHKNAEQIGQLFHQNLKGVPFTKDVDALIHIGRERLREKFLHADIGITGVNFAVADTGTLCLVENEGNGRMSSTIPNVHIAVTGIEKVIENMQQLPPLLSLLTRSATGQVITTYVNMINGPRQQDEQDGPQEVHLVLLDNGRSQAHASEQFAETLQCIRCGACMNHCPVYTRVGGHAYGTVYPGPLGKMLSPHLLGLTTTQDLPSASSLCGACEEVCPVDIPIPTLLQRLRGHLHQPNQGQPVFKEAGVARHPTEAKIWHAWHWLCTHPRAFRIVTRTMARLRFFALLARSPWTRCRAALKPANRTMYELIKAQQKSKGRQR